MNMSDIKQEKNPLNLTVPFTAEERLRFTDYCAEHGRMKGAFIRVVMCGVMDGKVDISPLLG